MLLALIVYILAVIIHELAHLITLRYFGVKSRLYLVKGRIKAGQQKDYEHLSINEYYFVTLNGVVAGLIFLILVGLPFWPALFLIFPYWIGSKSDIKEIDRLRGVV